MKWWNERVVPRLTDASLRGHDVGEWRQSVCENLHGEVLEIGFGSGLNVRWYPSTVSTVHAVEPSDLGWEISSKRRARSDVPIVRSGLDGEQLAIPDDSVDSVLCTFTLCTIPDVALALSEVRRVLRPGGTFAFLEHGLSPDPAVATWQRRLDSLEQRIAGGCHLTRDPVALSQATGFDVAVSRAGYLAGPRLGRPWTWLSAGTATVATRASASDQPR